jgi:hypothetical protein
VLSARMPHSESSPQEGCGENGGRAQRKCEMHTHLDACWVGRDGSRCLLLELAVPGKPLRCDATIPGRGRGGERPSQWRRQGATALGGVFLGRPRHSHALNRPATPAPTLRPAPRRGQVGRPREGRGGGCMCVECVSGFEPHKIGAGPRHWRWRCRLSAARLMEHRGSWRTP